MYSDQYKPINFLYNTHHLIVCDVLYVELQPEGQRSISCQFLGFKLMLKHQIDMITMINDKVHYILNTKMVSHTWIHYEAIHC